MKVLMVGCGAVGQVYGFMLQGAGAELGLYDRPEVTVRLLQAKQEGGLRLYQFVGRGREPVPRLLDYYTVLPDLEACIRFEPDQVWFTLPSPVYYTDWFRQFIAKVPAQRFVCFIPEGWRTEFIPEGAGERFIFGGTAFMAWQGGAEAGGGMAGGINFWLPPMAIPLVGRDEACRDTAQMLKQAGFKVTVSPPGSTSQAATTALMTAFTAGLELSGWSMKGYRRSPGLKRAAAACREAVMTQLPNARGLQKVLLSVPVLAAAFWLVALLLPALVPFDIQKYLRFHYTKTHVQTLRLLEMYIKDGKGKGMGMEQVEAMMELLTG